MSRSWKSEVASWPVDIQGQWLADQPTQTLAEIARDEWWWTRRPEQAAPKGDWFVWLLLAGRGFGKTRCAAEWLAERVLKYPKDTSGFRTEWLIIAETLTDGLRLCVRGPAGIGRVFSRLLGPERRSKLDRRGRWKVYGGAKPYIQIWDEHGEEAQVIYIEGADDEDVGRGYNAAGAWLDEFAKWPKPDGSWIEGIAPSLRAELPGDYPRVVVATTPKLVMQLIEWQDRRDGSVVVTSGSTYDNAGNLAAPTLRELHLRYHGTRLGRQELLGELIREIQGAMWTVDDIRHIRAEHLPELGIRVVGMDPAGTGERDETGLVAAGRGMDGLDYVLGDWSKQIAGNAAAKRAWEMVLAYQAKYLVVETNMAKRWVLDVLAQEWKAMRKAGTLRGTFHEFTVAAPVKTVNSYVGKELRAQPVAARYEQARWLHVIGQGLGDLETQMISWVPLEIVKGAIRPRRNDSPDRIDALVHAGHYLASLERREVGAVSPVAAQLPVTTLSPLS